MTLSDLIRVSTVRSWRAECMPLMASFTSLTKVSTQKKYGIIWEFFQTSDPPLFRNFNRIFF